MDTFHTGEKVKRLAYLLEDFLTPTTTFVTQEIQHLRSHGYDIQVYVAGSRVKEADPAVADLVKIAHFSREARVREIVFSHLAAVANFPAEYAATVRTIFRLTWNHPNHFIRAFWHFVQGIYLGRKMIDSRRAWVHVHFASRAATAAWSIWNVYRIPYSVTTHAYDLFANFNNRHTNELSSSVLPKRNSGSLLSLKLQEAQVIITISEFNRRYITEMLQIPAAKIRVVRCGVDMSRFQRQKSPKSARPVILSVGALVEKKGHDILIRACAYLRDWGYQFHCKIVGEGPLFQTLFALTKSLNLNEVVHFCGRVHHSEIPKYHKGADVFVLACVKGNDGNMDGIPVALMEAMAMEIPVVTTSLSGIPELVDSGVTGFLAETERPKDLAEKIRQLLDDAELRRRMGKLARRRILQDYDQERNSSLLESILSGVWTNDDETAVSITESKKIPGMQELSK